MHAFLTTYLSTYLLISTDPYSSLLTFLILAADWLVCRYFRRYDSLPDNTQLHSDMDLS